MAGHPAGHRLGIDFGTSHTVAVLRGPDGRSRPLVFDGSPLLPSGVTDHDGELATGADARHLADSRPAGHEPAPKARIDEGSVLLGGRDVEVCELIAAVLRRVRTEAERAAPVPPGATVLTVPAAWASHRRKLLAEAAQRAGLRDVDLTPEPVAAARYFVARLPELAREGATALVYDLGAGTFDATLVRRRGPDLDLLHTTGLPDAGGADIDEAIVAYLATVWAGAHPEVWTRLAEPRTDADRRARRRLWDGVRTAKEMLSRQPASIVHLPLAEAEFGLDRSALDRVAAPLLRRTVRSARAAVAAAGLEIRDVDAVLLVGGASRMPLVSTLLAEAFGRMPVAVDQPELVVAQGSLAAAPVAPDPAGSALTPSAVGPAPERSALTASAIGPEPIGPNHRRRRRWIAAATAAILVIAVTAGTVWLRPTAHWADPPRTSAASAGSSAASSPAAMTPLLAMFARPWPNESTCQPVGFEGPFDVESGIRSEMVEQFRCDITAGSLQGATVYFSRIGASTALEALRRHYGARTTGYAQLSRPPNNVIMWYETNPNIRCMGWLQVPSAAVSASMLYLEWSGRQYSVRASATGGTR